MTDNFRMLFSPYAGEKGKAEETSILDRDSNRCYLSMKTRCLSMVLFRLVRFPVIKIPPFHSLLLSQLRWSFTTPHQDCYGSWCVQIPVYINESTLHFCDCTKLSRVLFLMSFWCQNLKKLYLERYQSARLFKALNLLALFICSTIHHPIAQAWPTVFYLANESSYTNHSSPYLIQRW